MIPTPPEGARLALLNWPMGAPRLWQIIEAAGFQWIGDAALHRLHLDVVGPLLAASLVEAVGEARGVDQEYRLTQSGRKAVDVLQSGIE